MERVITVILFSLVLFTSCTYNVKEGISPNNCEGEPGTEISYAYDIIPILATYCPTCHLRGTADERGAGIVVELHENLSKIIKDGRFWGSIVQGPGYEPMPIGRPKMTDCELSTIQTWIEAGYPNN